MDQATARPVDESPPAPAEDKAGQRYLAFISYRRRDGGMVANWLRQRIGTFVAPRELRDKVAAADARVAGRFNRVFLDLSYQRSHTDFWRDHIAPSVVRSDNLLLLLTPSVFEKLPDGEPNWVEREIETFLDAGKDPARILLVLGPGATDDRLPDPLARLSARWDWADLRFFKSSSFSRWRHGADYDAQLTKILARIYDVDDGELPALTREFERARTRVHRRIYTAGATTIIGLAGLTAWATVERARAIRAEATAVQQRDEAVRQRNAALVAQSLFLTQTAAVFRRQGSARQAMKLLVPALPDKAHGNDRPLVGETVAETYRVLYGDRELARVALPVGTSAIATSGDGKTIAAVTPDEIVFLEMPAGRRSRAVTNPGGSATRVRLSVDGARLLLTSGDGRVRLVDSASGAELARHDGLQVKTRADFAAGGRQLLLRSGDDRRLVLLDPATGQSHTRDFGAVATAYLSDDGGTLLVAADGQVRSLSLDDLTDLATRPLTDEVYVAFAKSADGNAIAMASGSGMLKGSLAWLDPRTLAERRRFRLTLGAVTSVAISPDGQTVAVHTPPNLTFYEADSGFPQSVEATSATAGRFVATGYERYRNYAYGANGIITITVPGLNLQTNYKSEDEGEIVDVAMDEDGQAFTSITSTPLATRWSAKDVAVRRTLARDFRIGQNVLHNFPFLTSTGAADGKHVAVTYADGSIGIWDVFRDELLSNFSAPMQKSGEVAAMAMSDDASFIARGDSTGDVSVIDVARGKVAQAHVADQPIARIQFAPSNRLLIALKDGSVIGAEPGGDTLQTTPRPDLGACIDMATSRSLLQCRTLDGGARVFDASTGTEHWRTAEGSEGALSAIDVTPLGDRIVSVDRHGLLTLRSLNGETLWTLQLTSVLSGALLVQAANSPLVDDAARAAILKGATEVNARLPANGAVVAPDGRHVLVSFPDRSIQLVDLEARTAKIVLRFDQPVRYAVFSAGGAQIAAFAAAGDNSGRGSFQVYDIALGRVIYDTYGVYPPGGRIFPLADGMGFVLAMSPYALGVFPIYERAADLVATALRRYPDRLTPQQRQYFHIE